MPDIYTQAQLHRQAVLARDAVALQRVTSAYLPIFNQLQFQLSQLTAQIEEAARTGQRISKAWLARQERYRSLLAQIAVQIDRYAEGVVVPVLTAEQRTLVNLAQLHASQALATQMPSLAASFNRLPVGAIEQFVGFAGDGTPLNKLLKRYGRDVAVQVRETLLNGIATGQGVQKTARAVEQLIDRPRWEAARLVRTESLRSYREASNEVYKSSGVVKGKMRLAAHSTRTCANCLALDGTIYPLDAPQDFHPNDRCTYIPVLQNVELPQRQTGAEWFAQQSAEDQAKVLGVSGAKAYRDGLPLQNWIGVSKSKQWGEMRYQRSLADAQKGPQRGALPAPVNAKPATVPVVAPPKPQPTHDANGFPFELGSLKTVRQLGGSTGAELVEDSLGNRFVRKRGASPDHLREEFLADEAYRALGVPVPRTKLYEGADGPVKLAEFIEGQSLGSLTGPAREAAEKELRKHFAADALLGNWDVVGLAEDNVLIDKAGKLWRIDNGGSLRYRAMGAQKNAQQWGSEPTELWSMRDYHVSGKAGQIFSQLELEDLPVQVDALVKRRAQLLDALPPEVRDTVRARLARMEEIADDWRAGKFKTLTAGEIDRIADTQAWESWFDGLTRAEREAVLNYTGPAHGEINRFLRGIETRTRHQNTLPALDRALDQARAGEDMVVFRGTHGARNAQLYQLFKDGRVRWGGDWQDKGYFSTSADRGVAKGSFGGAQEVVFIVRVRKGSTVAYLGDSRVSYASHEREILFPRGSMLRIDRVREENGSIFVEALLE